MPSRPAVKSTTGVFTSVGLINSILNDPRNTELAGIPKATATTQSIRAVGEQITAFAPRRNQFINSLINRIAMTRIESLRFSNPWSWAKQGKLEMGETVEQIWLDLAKAYTYNPEKSETHVLKQEKPTALTQFHSVNFQVFYKITVNESELKSAFLSVDGLVDFINRIISQLVQSANADEFTMMKYLIDTLLINGNIKIMNVPEFTGDNADEITTAVKKTTNLFQFPSREFTMAGNENSTPVDDIMVLESAEGNAYLDVKSLATAINIDYVKFMGNVTMYDSLSNLDWNRLDDLLHDDPTYRHFTSEEIDMLDSVNVITMDRSFMQIYDKLDEMGEPFQNGEGLFTNYFYHVWEIFSASPFHNCVAFSNTHTSYNSVSVVPSVAKVVKGQAIQLMANVSGDGFISGDVIWTITGQSSKHTFIEPSGVIHVGLDEDTASIIVYATTKHPDDDGKTVYGTATINVGDAEKLFERFIVTPESLTVYAGEEADITALALYTDGTTEAVEAVAQGGSGNIASVTVDGYTVHVVTTEDVGTGYILFSTLDGTQTSDAYPVITIDPTDKTSTKSSKK